MKYRKLPVVIEVIRWSGKDDTNRLINWLALMDVNINKWLFHDTDITIPTLVGPMKATPGDWIIKGIKGEFYPCKNEIFAASYEPVSYD